MFIVFRGIDHRFKCWEHVTQAIRRDQWSSVAEAAAVIRQHIAPAPEWSFAVKDGACTFLNVADPHQVITVFVDHGGVIADRERMPPQGDRIVVGVQLTSLSLAAQEYAREGMSNDWQGSYMDPRCGHNLYAIRATERQSPKHQLICDLIILGHGRCDAEVSEPVRTEIEDAVGRFLENDRRQAHLG